MRRPAATSITPRDVAIDTNLLILLAVGLAYPADIAKSSLLSAYSDEDFLLLAAYLRRAVRPVLVQNVLTETSNALRTGFRDPRGADLLGHLAGMVMNVGEHVADSRTVMRRPEFLRLALTDAALIEVCSNGAVLLTADGALSAGCRAVHFEEPRSLDFGAT